MPTKPAQFVIWVAIEPLLSIKTMTPASGLSGGSPASAVPAKQADVAMVPKRKVQILDRFIGSSFSDTFYY
jgi:hypothetical protein